MRWDIQYALNTEMKWIEQLFIAQESFLKGNFASVIRTNASQMPLTQ